MVTRVGRRQRQRGAPDWLGREPIVPRFEGGLKDTHLGLPMWQPIVIVVMSVYMWPPSVGTSSETTKLKGFAVPEAGLTQQGIGRRFPAIILQQRLPKQRNGNKALVGSIAARRVEYLEAVAHGKEDEFTNDNTNSDVLPSISTSNGFSMY